MLPQTGIDDAYVICTRQAALWEDFMLGRRLLFGSMKPEMVKISEA